MVNETKIHTITTNIQSNLVKEGPTNPRVTIAVTRQLNLLRNKAPDGKNIKDILSKKKSGGLQ